MKLRRSLCASIAAITVVCGLSVGESQAQYRRMSYTPIGPVYESYAPFPGPVFHSYMFPPYYSTPHYILPLPGYGVLPPHLATNPWHQYGYGGQRFDSQFPEPRGQVIDPLDYTPRKRNALYPAVPFEKTREERLGDVRRVRFEITVPYENARVLFDGVETKQTGLTRTFVTPPMEEDREYNATIRVEFVRKGETDIRTRQKAFTFVAGETVKHTFVE